MNSRTEPAGSALAMMTCVGRMFFTPQWAVPLADADSFRWAIRPRLTYYHRLRWPFNRVASPIFTDPQDPKFWLSTESGRRKAAWALLVAGMIFLASSRSRVAAPDLLILPVDKVAHFGVYGLLGTLLCRIGSGWRAAVWAVVAASAYGVSDEFHQSFVPGRGVEFADWVADTAGAALAVGLYRGWAPYRKLLETPLWRRRAIDASSAGQ